MGIKTQKENKGSGRGRIEMGDVQQQTVNIFRLVERDGDREKRTEEGTLPRILFTQFSDRLNSNLIICVCTACYAIFALCSLMRINPILTAFSAKKWRYGNISLVSDPSMLLL